MGVGGEDGACNKRWRRRGSLRLAAATDYWSAGRPDRYLPAEPSLGKQPSIGELVTDTMQELLENQVTGVWLIAGAVPGVLRAAVRRLRGTGGPTTCRTRRRRCAGPCRAQCSTRR